MPRIPRTLQKVYDKNRDGKIDNDSVSVEGVEGPPGQDGADGFPTETQWNDLVARVEALENAGQ
ncbi:MULTISPECIES: hypothetical protein [unclassified Oceanobacillus]|uniref:hypothetical protein n=1 Tax=Oceanobacillus TaxID=182709 RepID=UPI001BEA0DAF|nr:MULTISPECIES: hypothetical protein [unclassified Oceanobacillus]MBT2601417.1 hypothetical protein [Oceanobacillus sp. ISL-74]MBT2653306.1 hypothetical protein [Oceanobacillus sp. ISL-73]